MILYRNSPAIQDAISRLLQTPKELSNEDRKLLEAYQTPDTQVKIPLELLRKMSELLRKKTPLGNLSQHRPPIWVHELVEGSEIVLPEAEQRKISPEHEAHLERLRAASREREYQRMIQAVAPWVTGEDPRTRDRQELRDFNAQAGVAVNILVSMATLFALGYFVASTALHAGKVMSVVAGLLLSIMIMLVEVWLFIIRTSRVDQVMGRQKPLIGPARREGSPHSGAGSSFHKQR